MNTANPLPTPTDTNPSAAQGDLPSSNLDLTSANSGAVGGCWGATNILASTSTTAFGSGSTAHMTLPSSWVNGGNCAYGSLGSNSAGGNTDTPALNAARPVMPPVRPTRPTSTPAYVSCGLIVSSGNDENGSTNYSIAGPLLQRPARAPDADGHPVEQQRPARGHRHVSPVAPTGGAARTGHPTPAPTVTSRTVPATSTRSAHRASYIGTIAGHGRARGQLDGHHLGQHLRLHRGRVDHRRAQPLHADRGPADRYLPGAARPGPGRLQPLHRRVEHLPAARQRSQRRLPDGARAGTWARSSRPLRINVEGVMVVKTSTTAYPDGGYSQAGDQITYSYAVTNNGPGHADQHHGQRQQDPECRHHLPELVPGRRRVGDLHRHLHGDPGRRRRRIGDQHRHRQRHAPSNETVTSAPSSVTVYASDADSSLSLTKSTTSTGYGAAGDTIPYSYLVTNTGTTTLTEHRGRRQPRRRGELPELHRSPPAPRRPAPAPTR